MKRTVLTIIFVGLLAACGGSPTEPSRCDQEGALNRGARDTCQFSRVAFYVTAPAPFPITVSIDGVPVSTPITGFWPTGPGNCSADFTAKMQLADGRVHDWNARAANGLAWSGQLRARPTDECMRIQIF